MKRIISFVLLLVMMVNIFPLKSTAEEYAEDTISLGNGCYIAVEIVENNIRTSGSKTASKKYTYYDSDDVSQWTAVLTGTFTYTGSSAACTSSSVSTTIYDSSWTVVSKSASKSGNTASAYVKMGDTVAGVVATIVPISLTLSCDANGNLS